MMRSNRFAPWGLACSCVLSIVAPLSGAQTASTESTPIPAMDVLLARMAQARADNRASFRPYAVTRQYALFGKDPNKSKAEIVADLTFVPPDTRHHSIQRSSGTGIGVRVVRQMLEHETGVVKDYTATDISSANYTFRLLGEEIVNGRRSFVLELSPRRKEKTLLRGKTWVDASTYLLHRTEGQPSKSVSWWVRDERITLSYGEVGGMWLQTSSESSANVRFLGRHRMVSRDLDYKLGELAATDR